MRISNPLPLQCVMNVKLFTEKNVMKSYQGMQTMNDISMNLSPFASYALIVGLIFVIWAALFLPTIIRNRHNNSKRKKRKLISQFFYPPDTNCRCSDDLVMAEWITKKAIEISQITNVSPETVRQLLSLSLLDNVYSKLEKPE